MPPKRPPQDIEHLLCAMIQLKDIPHGREWNVVADLMPDRPDGEKQNGEALRGMWRRLKARWEEEGIWPKDRNVPIGGGDETGEPSKTAKAKGKGKEKEKAKKAKPKKSETVAKDESKEETGGQGEGSDAGINAGVRKKTIRLSKVKTAQKEQDEEMTSGDEA